MRRGDHSAPCWRLAGLLFMALAGGGVASGMPDATLAEATANTERVVASITTGNDPAQQYSLFLPAGYPAGRRWPLLIILDPRGRAEATLEMARAAAAEHGWIVLSSHQSRSDGPEAVTFQALQALLREAGERYAYDPGRVYLAGMSGTAKSLWVAEPSLHGLVAGMIGSAGGRPPELGKSLNSPPAFYGITGTQDFNYQEMHELDDALARTGSPHRLAVFKGGHGWPPDPADFRAAMDWLELTAMRSGLAPRREDWIAAQWSRAQARLGRAADSLERWRELDQLVRDFSGLRDIDAERMEASRLGELVQTRERLALEGRLAGEERRYARSLDAWVARYYQHSANGSEQAAPDPVRSLAELRVQRLQALARDGDARIADSAGRRLQRLYAATSSYLPEAQWQLGDLPRARVALRMATMVLPERARPHCRLAQVEARAHRYDDAFAALDECLRLGWRDLEDLRSNPDWKPLASDPRWPSVLQAAGAPDR